MTHIVFVTVERKSLFLPIFIPSSRSMSRRRKIDKRAMEEFLAYYGHGRKMRMLIFTHALSPSMSSSSRLLDENGFVPDI